MARATRTQDQPQARKWMRHSNAVTGFLVFLFLLGVALIFIGSKSNISFWNQFLIGAGVAIGPAALVSLLFRYFLIEDVNREFTIPLTGQLRSAVNEILPEEANRILGEHRLQLAGALQDHNKELAEILEKYREEASDIDSLHQGGLIRCYRNREEAAVDFIHRCEEIEQKPLQLTVIGSSLKGLIRDKNAPFVVDVLEKDPSGIKFVLTHPVIADLRAHQEGRKRKAIGHEIIKTLRLLEQLEVPASNVYLYRGTPTCFGIMAQNLMLLNPYPYEAVAMDAPCLLVEHKTGKDCYFYEHFKTTHFSRIEDLSVTTQQLSNLGQDADYLEDKLSEYGQVADLVERLAPL